MGGAGADQKKQETDKKRKKASGEADKLMAKGFLKGLGSPGKKKGEKAKEGPKS